VAVSAGVWRRGPGRPAQSAPDKGKTAYSNKCFEQVFDWPLVGRICLAHKVFPTEFLLFEFGIFVIIQKKKKARDFVRA
jgi:hypothetical protein